MAQPDQIGEKYLYVESSIGASIVPKSKLPDLENEASREKFTIMNTIPVKFVTGDNGNSYIRATE